MVEDGTWVGAGTPPPGVSSRARARAALALVGRNRTPGNPVLEPLLQVVRGTHPKADVAVIERAYAVAERAHEGQKRRSGDDYITHPLAVTTILAELGMTPTTLAAALLHDTVEDTSYSLEALRRDFGDEIAMLVDGVTKLDKVTYGQAAQAETVRKMVVAMARDIRVLVIKLADRLHNARTWRYVSQESAARKAKETLEIYAPLAHRLGMNTIKWELEDLSFQALYPKVYDEIVRLVAERAPAREEYLATVRDEVSADLATAKIKATVTGRPKHYYSVYQKMIVGGRDFEQIYDLVAVRVTRGDRARLLRGAGGAARPVEPGAGAVQGLHRDAEVQHVPVVAHDGHRPGRQARRDPDPHAHDAPPGRVRRRGPLEVQGRAQRQGCGRPGGSGRGAGPRRPDRSDQRHGLVAPAARLAEGDLRPG
jgi:GTP pyrophosphokinase